MSSAQANLQQIINQMIYVVPFILLFMGAFGCLGNFITFTSKQLKNNSCAFYFLSTTTFELFTLSFGLISRIADQYGSTLQKQSRIYCKIRYYLALTFPTIASYLLLMAAIDRCMSTSMTVKYRKFSQRKIAQRMVLLVIIICMIACSHTLIFVDHQPSCLPQSGPYSLFYSIYLIGFCSLLPNGLLLMFGIWTIQHVKKIRRRMKQKVMISHQQQRRQKTDGQFVIMVVSQVIVSCAIDITRLTCYSYYLLTVNRSKSTYYQTVDTFIFQFSLVLSYFNYSESFYTNTLTSTLFRKIFRETCQSYCQRLVQILMICNRQNQNILNVDLPNNNGNHLELHPVGNNRMNSSSSSL